MWTQNKDAHTHVYTHSTHKHIHKHTQDKDACRTHQVQGTGKHTAGHRLGAYESRRYDSVYSPPISSSFSQKSLKAAPQSPVTQATTFSRKHNGQSSVTQGYSHQRVSHVGILIYSHPSLWKTTPKWSVFSTVLKCGTPNLQLKLWDSGKGTLSHSNICYKFDKWRWTLNKCLSNKWL